jgi:hypothetical protein
MLKGMNWFVLCLMVVPACPIYPSLYTKNHHYTRREARQGKARQTRRGEENFPFPFPSFRFTPVLTARQLLAGIMEQTDDLRA